MTDPHPAQRQCPTRSDGRAALFTHRVHEAECQNRQRGMFHRCFSCVYNNAWVARNGLPTRHLEAPPAVASVQGQTPDDGPAAELSLKVL